MTSPVQACATLPALRHVPGNGPVYYGRASSSGRYFRAELRRLMDQGAKRFCDVGGGAKPVVSLAQIQRRDIDYVIFDFSQAELDRAPAEYQRFQGDALDAGRVHELVERHGPFDVVISRWTAEHVADGLSFHARVFDMLRPGGTAIHLFPTLYSPPFLINRVLSYDLSSVLLFRVFKARKVKFPARYSWCRGPTRRQIGLLRALGYDIERYVGFFGHNYYSGVKALDRAQRRFSDLLLAHPRPRMTSFSVVVLRRPGL